MASRSSLLANMVEALLEWAKNLALDKSRFLGFLMSEFLNAGAFCGGGPSAREEGMPAALRQCGA